MTTLLDLTDATLPSGKVKVPARPAATWPALVATRSSSAQRVTGLNPKLGKRDERDRLAARDTGRFFRDLDQPVGGAQAGD